MDRRTFLGGAALGPWAVSRSVFAATTAASEHQADVVIVGGGCGGCAAVLAAARAGQWVILTEETDWIGGQLSQQAVPPDEHPWIEACGGLAETLLRAYLSRGFSSY